MRPEFISPCVSLTAPASQNLNSDVERLGDCNICVFIQASDKSLNTTGRNSALRSSPVFLVSDFKCNSGMSRLTV